MEPIQTWFGKNGMNLGNSWIAFHVPWDNAHWDSLAEV